ncbi:MAG TPA: XdhC family protein [Gemmatimonadales bacterium]|nr:XdhC family protein [Gemmatimonadales bacterium]
MRDVLPDYERLRTAGAPVGRAVVTSVWGSAPRAEGACLLASASGGIAGSVSGGCVEGATVTEIQEAIARRTPKLVTFGVSDETAWSVGLACGGTIKVWVEGEVPERVLRAAASEEGMVVGTIVERSGKRETGIGGALTVAETGAVEADPGLDWLGDAVRGPALAALRREQSTTVEVPAPEGGSCAVFLEVFPRRPVLFIIGAVHIAIALVPLARTLGYHTVVADGRAAFLTRERFPDADQLVAAWPEEAFRQVGITPATYVCLLSHDPKFDEPALRIALRSPAPYVGAIGSKKTQAKRRERLAGEGYTAEEMARLHGPIGLDLGGRAPAETALAILAEVTAVRYGGAAVAK